MFSIALILDGTGIQTTNINYKQRERHCNVKVLMFSFVLT